MPSPHTDTGDPLPLADSVVCVRRTRRAGFLWGGAVGTLGGLVGLGGAEFRLPVLLQIFQLAPLVAVLVNLRVSLVTVVAALCFRIAVQGAEGLAAHLAAALPVLGGALLGAWWGATLAGRLNAATLRLAIAALLALLAVVLFAHGAVEGADRLALDGLTLAAVGLVAGLGIGMVSSLLGVAGGELIIPTLVLLYGLDVKVAGTVSLAISLPTLLVSLSRHRRRSLSGVQPGLVSAMAIGSVLGAAVGAGLLLVVSPPALHALLGAILLISAFKLAWAARKATH